MGKLVPRETHLRFVDLAKPGSLESVGNFEGLPKVLVESLELELTEREVEQFVLGVFGGVLFGHLDGQALFQGSVEQQHCVIVNRVHGGKDRAEQTTWMKACEDLRDGPFEVGDFGHHQAVDGDGDVQLSFEVRQVRQRLVEERDVFVPPGIFSSPFEHSRSEIDGVDMTKCLGQKRQDGTGAATEIANRFGFGVWDAFQPGHQRVVCFWLERINEIFFVVLGGLAPGLGLIRHVILGFRNGFDSLIIFPREDCVPNDSYEQSFGWREGIGLH